MSHFERENPTPTHEDAWNDYMLTCEMGDVWKTNLKLIPMLFDMITGVEERTCEFCTHCIETDNYPKCIAIEKSLGHSLIELFPGTPIYNEPFSCWYWEKRVRE